MFSTPPITVKHREKLNARLECASEHVLAHASNVENIPSRRAQSNMMLQNSKCAMSTSTRKSSSAQKKQLELEAARARAQIQIELINKKLEVDIAALDEADTNPRGYSSRSSGRTHVEEWLDHGMAQQPSQVPQAGPAAPTMAKQEPQLAAGNSQLLTSALPVDSLLHVAQALKDIMVASHSSKEDRLLTRLATPRDLPVFGGDCVEWLHFKSAYEESTRVCQFTTSENLWRLRRALKGDAKESVTDLLIGNTSPEDIMKTLELRFGQSDIIVENLTYRIKKLSPLPVNYQSELITFSTKVSNCVSILRALNKEDYLRSPEVAAAVVSKLPCVMLSRWTDYAFPRLNKGVPKLELLATFLQKEAEMISVVGVVQRKPEPSTDKRYEGKSRAVLLTNPVESKCKFCKKGMHILTECRMFKKALRKERWRFAKANNLCFCCLQADKHNKSTCLAPLCTIDNCGLPHNELLHFKKPSNQTSTPSEEPRQALEAQEQAPSTTVALVTKPPEDAEQQRQAARSPASVPKCNVMLKVVKVNLCGASGAVSAYALLDDGAAISMIDADLAKELGVNSFKSEPIRLVDAFGIEVYQANTPKINVKISSYNSNNCYDIVLRQVNELKLPMQDLSGINKINCKHLKRVKDYVTKECVVPRMLIGEDNYYLLAPLEILHGSENEPYATRCRLGWSIHGCCGRTHTPVSGNTLLLDKKVNADEENLNEFIKHMFELDSIGVSTVRRENKAHLRAVEMLDSTARYLGHRWEVGLPFHKDTFTLPDSFEYARCRLRNLLKKCQADSVYYERYLQEMEKLFASGYARELTDDELSASNVWYLSHFGVQNPNKPGKIRLVFDCAGKVNGVCLNDLLLTGPDLYNSLLGIMLRFGKNTFVFIGDINIIHKQGGFEITRWASSSKRVLHSIPSEALAPTAVEFKHGSNNTMERTLGLMWYPSDDSFGFKISLNRVPKNILDGIEPPTKAKMLSIIMSVYDLHGFLSPFIIKGKIIFQNVHRSGVAWNCRIQPAEHTAWVHWLNDLKRLEALRIPRCYAAASAWTRCYTQDESSRNNCEILEIQMHIFCDASAKSYAAVIYWRFIRADGYVLICLAASKSRVSPLRPISIPRLGHNRTVKTALKVVLKHRAPHPDTLVTLLAEVEALVNSRPITHVSTDPRYPEALTPNHFLIGTSFNGPTFGKYDDNDLCLRKRWHIAQRLADMFWTRWVREYLPTLLPRQKLNQESRSLQVGDYVILTEPNRERNSWRHGVVSATHAGADGRVRIVDVRTRTGSLRRPVTRVALLSPNDNLVLTS